MSGPPEDGRLVNVPLSDSSDDSIQRSPQEEQSSWTKSAVTSGPFSTVRPFLTTGLSSETEPFLFSGIFPAENSSLIPGLTAVDEPSSTTESGWTNLPTYSALPATTSEPTEPVDSSPPKIETFIHPVSEGGSVTWKDHRDLVFHKGKDRGPRAPAPTLPKGYKSKGPLKNFPFDKLRGDNERRAPLRKFQDEYSGKQDETPTELVTQIVAYYVQNEDEKLRYLMDKTVKIQGLNDQVRLQEQKINTIKEDLAETKAVKKFSAEREQKIKDLNEELKDKEEVIKNLRHTIVELEDENPATKDIDTEEFIKTLMGRIADLEAERKQNEESSTTMQDPDNANKEKRINDLVREVQRKENTINNLFFRINELEEAQVQLQEEHSTTSQHPSRTEQETRMKALDQNIEDRDIASNDLANMLPEQQEADTIYEETRSTSSRDPAGPVAVPSVKELIKMVKEIKASLLESKVRCLLLQAKSYMDEKEYSAAGKETLRAEAILRRDLPHLKVLHGKVLYRHGKAMYEQGFLPEAIRDLRGALKMGFDGDCTEVDGDCVRPLLIKARSAHKQAVKLGYPTGADV